MQNIVYEKEKKLNEVREFFFFVLICVLYFLFIYLFFCDWFVRFFRRVFFLQKGFSKNSVSFDKDFEFYNLFLC